MVFDVFVGRKLIFTSYSSTTLKVLLNSIFFNIFIYLFIYLFIGCVGSSFLCEGFL